MHVVDDRIKADLFIYGLDEAIATESMLRLHLQDYLGDHIQLAL